MSTRSQVDEEQAVPRGPAPSGDSVEKEQVAIKANFDLTASSSTENLQVRFGCDTRLGQKLAEMDADVFVTVGADGAFVLLWSHLSTAVVFLHDLNAINSCCNQINLALFKTCFQNS